MINFTPDRILSNDAWLMFNSIIFAVLCFSYRIKEVIKDKILGFIWFGIFLCILVSSLCFFLNKVYLGKIITTVITIICLLLSIIFFILIYLVPASWVEWAIKVKNKGIKRGDLYE